MCQTAVPLQVAVRGSFGSQEFTRDFFSSRTFAPNRQGRDIRQRDTLAVATSFVSTLGPLSVHGRNRTLNTPVRDAFHALYLHFHVCSSLLHAASGQRRYRLRRGKETSHSKGGV